MVIGKYGSNTQASAAGGFSKLWYHGAVPQSGLLGAGDDPVNPLGSQVISTSIQYGPQPHVAASEPPLMVMSVGESVPVGLTINTP